MHDQTVYLDPDLCKFCYNQSFNKSRTYIRTCHNETKHTHTSHVTANQQFSPVYTHPLLLLGRLEQPPSGDMTCHYRPKKAHSKRHRYARFFQIFCAVQLLPVHLNTAREKRSINHCPVHKGPRWTHRRFPQGCSQNPRHKRHGQPGQQSMPFADVNF